MLPRATTADAARELGISHGLASHHLRQLAKYGFVEQVEGKDHRERPWRMVATSYNWSKARATPEGSVAVDVLEQIFAERALQDFLDWQQRSKDWPEPWRKHAGVGQSSVYLTQAELAEIDEAFDALLMRYINERPIDDVASRPEGSVQQFFSPAEQAMVPRLVPDDELLTANAVNGQVSNVSRLVGSALGGILAAAGGIVAVTLIDTASFLASAALLALVRTSGRTISGGSGSVQTRLTQVGAELRDGLRLATRNRVLRALMIFALVTSVGEGTMSTLFTPFVEHVLHGTPQDLGLVVAAQAVGGIAGGMVAAAFGHRMQAGRLLSYGAVAFGLVDLAIFLYPLGYVAVWPAVAGMIIVGLPGALTLAGLITLFQRSSQDSYRGRVFGAVSASEGVTVLAGALGAGYLSRFAGIIPVLAVQGTGYVVAGLVVLAWLKDGADPPVPAADRGESGGRGSGQGEPTLVAADEGVRRLPSSLARR